jgi:hypothetical protein
LRFRTEIIRLAGEIEQLLASDQDQYFSVEEEEFVTKKEEILYILSTLYGETSREYRVVKLSSSPATAVKVLKHIVGRPQTSLP